MNILLLESYYTGSHKYWADNIVKYSQHKVHLLTMPGRFWKWRMKGSAIYFHQEILKLNDSYDLILCSSLTDVALLKSLLAKDGICVPVVYYMHENQLTYPYSDLDNRDQEDFHYGFQNYTSCLAADLVIFNSEFHRAEFLTAIEKLLKRLPDHQCLDYTKALQEKSHVVGVGLDLNRIDEVKSQLNSQERITPRSPTILWNHRWEADKNPQLFYDLCSHLKSEGIDFRLIITGQNTSSPPSIFVELKNEFSSQIDFFGYADSYSEYIKLLIQADILPVTSNQDFYGLSFLEAVYCDVCPIIPSGRVYEEHFDGISNELIYSDKTSLIDSTTKYIDRTSTLLDSNFSLKSEISVKYCISQLDTAMTEML